MDIVQSLIFTCSRMRLSLYEQRIVAKIVERAQRALRGRSLSGEVRQAQRIDRAMAHPLEHEQFEIPARELLGEKSQHYEYIYDAARQLMSRKVEWYDPSMKTWFATPLIYNVQVRQRSGVVRFAVAKPLFDVILDFRQGYSRFNLEGLLQLPSVAAMRLYCLMCSQHHAMQWSVPMLRAMFNVADDAYPNNSDFVRRIIEPARKQLDESGLVSFSYSLVRNGRKIVAIKFLPLVPKQLFEDERPIGADETSSVKQCMLLLSSYAGFIPSAIRAHRQLIVRFCRHVKAAPQLMYDIISKSQSSKIHNAQGYIVNAMKGEIKRAEDRVSS